MNAQKEEKFLAVARATMEIMSLHGPEALSHSRISRSAGVSRAWIYKYVGAKEEELIQLAVETFGKRYAQIEKPFVASSPEAWVEDELARTGEALRVVREYPWIVSIYFRFRGIPNAVGKAIDRFEAGFIHKKSSQLRSIFPISEEQALVSSEVLTSIKLALAHRWVVAGLSKKIEHDVFMAYCRTLYTMMGSWKPPVELSAPQLQSKRK